MELSLKHGALGARLTGAGWGGCIVAVMPQVRYYCRLTQSKLCFIQENVAEYQRNVKNSYYSDLEADKSLDLNKVIFPTAPGPGAQLWKV